MTLTMADFDDCVSTGPLPGEVGYAGDIEELREYPCNCFTCRNEPSAVSSEAYGDCYHDGELSWWRCVFCGRYFDLEDLELLSGDRQGCEPCTGAWERALRETVPEPPRCTGDELQTGEIPSILDDPGTASVA